MIATVPLCLISQHAFAQTMLDESTGHMGLYSTTVFNPGDIICPFFAKEMYKTPSYLTVQTGDDDHITLSPEFLQYINHSCQPNVFFDTHSMQLVCLQTIVPGDQLTFFYPSTEWQMDRPFDCACGTSNCVGYITGAANMDAAILSHYQLTHFIQNKLSKLRQ
jgi:hypothetical protein